MRLQISYMFVSYLYFNTRSDVSLYYNMDILILYYVIEFLCIKLPMHVDVPAGKT